MNDAGITDCKICKQPDCMDTPEPCRSCGALSCDDCGEHYVPHSLPSKRSSDVDRCADCEDNASEAAWESHCENFYGGSTPVTIQERCDAARRVKAGQ